MLHLAKYGLLFLVTAMGTQILGRVYVMMPLMMTPAAFNATALSDQAHERLIQDGLRELEANRGGYRLIYLRRIETDGHAFSKHKFRQVIYEQTASFHLRLLDSPSIDAKERLAILDVGQFKADSVPLEVTKRAAAVRFLFDAARPPLSSGLGAFPLASIRVRVVLLQFELKGPAADA